MKKISLISLNDTINCNEKSNYNCNEKSNYNMDSVSRELLVELGKEDNRSEFEKKRDEKETKDFKEHITNLIESIQSKKDQS